ncbi:hypothetical protein HOD20_03155, partial [archaeon]|nr:hypothetical protein [archaeon]
ELETWLSATYLDKKKTNSVTEINDQLWAGRSFFYSAFNNSFGQGEKYEKSEFLNTYITKDSSELSDLLQQLPNPTDALRTSYEDLLGYIENNYRAARDEKSKYLVTKGDLENRLNRFDTILNDDLGLIWPIRMGFKEGEDFFDQYDKKGKWISWILNKRVNKYASTMEKDKVAEKGIKRGMVNLYLASRDIAEMYNVPTANIK